MTEIPLARECGCTTKQDLGRCCGAAASYHFALRWIPPVYVENCYTCAEHVTDAFTYQHHQQYHKVGPNCGMPGSVWCAESNTCVIEGDSELLEIERRILQCQT